MDRQEGYYWVKFKYGKPEIAKWTSNNGLYYWCIFECDQQFQDCNFEHINEVRIKSPGELPD
jgi:hypothetical protein